MDRDMNDPDTRRAAGAACIVQYRDECEARADVDAWDDWTPGRDVSDAIGRAIDRHASRVIGSILERSHE